MRLGGAGDLGRGLAGLGQHAGVRAPDHLGAAFAQQRRDGDGAPRPSRPGPCRSAPSAPREIRPRPAPGPRPGPRSRSRPGVRNRSTARIGMEQREGQRHRHLGDILAADVQQPGDGIGQRQHRRRLARRWPVPPPAAPVSAPALSPAFSSGQGRTLPAGGAGWSARSHRPDWRRAPALCPFGAAQLFDLGRGVQPGVDSRSARPAAALRASQSASCTSGQFTGVNTPATCALTCSR